MSSISDRANSAKAKSKELRDKIDTSLDTLAKAIDTVRASETFQQYLTVLSRFHHYSWHNTMLIATQRPEATQVAGYRAWQKLKRQVRKGERGITIFAPCPFKREVETTNGSNESVSGVYFKAVHVFDVEQTDGPDLPTLDLPVIEESANDLLSKLSHVANERSIQVTFARLSDGLFGISKGGTVEVDNTHPTGQQAKTLAHELAHESLHKTDRTNLTRSMAELEAESVAYVVCTHFGLDVEVRASRYIAIWDGDAKALRASLERIATTARSLIDDVEAIDNRKAVA